MRVVVVAALLAVLICVASLPRAALGAIPATRGAALKHDDDTGSWGTRPITQGYPAPMRSDDGDTEGVPSTHTPMTGYPSPYHNAGVSPSGVPQLPSYENVPRFRSNAIHGSPQAEFAHSHGIPAPPVMPNLPAVPELTAWGQL